MKISDKFPEIKFFIENPTSYEILYYQDDRIHNEYPLEVSEAKRIFDYIDYLEYMSKKQKEAIDSVIELMENFISSETYKKINGTIVADNYLQIMKILKLILL